MESRESVCGTPSVQHPPQRWRQHLQPKCKRIDQKVETGEKGKKYFVQFRAASAVASKQAQVDKEKAVYDAVGEAVSGV